MRRLALALAAAAFTMAGARAGTFADLSYGPDRLQRLDLHVPDGAGPAPVVVYFHGGAFVGGDKHPCAPQFANLLAARGIAFACADYRLAPAAPYPAPMRDGALAVQWLRAHAAQYGLDPGRVALFGMSAGAGVALWVASRPDLADPGSPDPVLRQSSAVAAVVAGNAQATYDPAEIRSRLGTDRLPKWLAGFYGAPSLAALSDPRFRGAESEASPMAGLHEGEPPILLYYAKPPAPLPPDSAPQDYIHAPAQGDILAAVARERGVQLTLTSSADTGGWPGFLQEAVTFLSGHLGR